MDEGFDPDHVADLHFDRTLKGMSVTSVWRRLLDPSILHNVAHERPAIFPGARNSSSTVLSISFLEAESFMPNHIYQEPQRMFVDLPHSKAGGT